MLTEPGFYIRVNQPVRCEIIGPVPPSTQCAIIPAGWTVPKMVEFDRVLEVDEVIVRNADGKRPARYEIK